MFNQTHTHTPPSPSPRSLALPQGGLHTLPSLSLVEVDEREGQGDVEGVGSARRRSPFPRLERDGEVHPGRRTLGLEALDEVLTEDLTQHGFKGQVHSDRTVRTAWKKNGSFKDTKIQKMMRILLGLIETLFHFKVNQGSQLLHC